MEQQMRDLSVSDSSDSSTSPTMWPHGVANGSGTNDANLHLSSMMHPLYSQLGSSSASSTPLQSAAAPSSNNVFDFSSSSSSAQAQQHYNSLYQNGLAAYSSWPYSGYGFQAAAYQGMYGMGGDFKGGDFKAEVSLPATTGNNSAATTPTAGGPSATASSFDWTNSHSGKKKRQPYKKDQISRLEYEYVNNSYLTNKRRAELSRTLMLDEKQVKVWFQNRRMKEKKLKQRVAGPFPHGLPITPCYD